MNKFDIPPIKELIRILSIVWFILIVGSFFWHIVDIRRDIKKLAEREVMSRLHKDTCYRYWIASMGGIYVPATNATANKFLQGHKDSELVTTTGERLVLINPAYVTRMVFEINKKLYGAIGHITSLKPVNPANTPDPWEKAALMAFEHGETHKISIVNINGERYIRAIQVLKVKKVCLKCHKTQGYKVGDIRGGLSLALPFAKFQAIIDEQIRAFAIVHGLILLLGWATLFLGAAVTKRSRRKWLTALHKTSSLKDLILDLATGFINIPADSLDEHINRTLGMAGTFLKMDRAYLFEYDFKAGTTSNTHEWCAEGISPHIQDLQNLPIDPFPDWINSHLRGEVIQIPCVQDLPEGPQKEALEMQSIKSLITVPLMYEGSCLGFVGFDAVRSHKELDQDHVSLIKMMSEIYANVLKRKEMLMRLRTSEKRYKELVEGLPIGLYRMTPEGRFIMLNRTMAMMLGYEDSNALMGKDVATFGLNMEKFLGGISTLRKQGVVRDREVQLRRRNGELFHASISAQACCDEQGHIVGIEGSVQDITDRKKGEEEKAKLQAQLQQAQKMESIGRLAGGIAHDFNNLLVPILGYSELLMATASHDKQICTYVGPIMEAGGKAKDIVSQLLAFSRKQIIEKKPIDLNDTITSFKKFLRHTLREDIEIILELEPEIPLIEADVSQMEQVLMNLAVNAQDAMPHGGRIVISTSVIEIDNGLTENLQDMVPGRHVLLSISDNGEGMDREIQKRIFEPFFTTKPQEKGTGLGLSTVYGIVKQHNGNIFVHSEQGRGTTFKIYLPTSDRQTLSKSCAKEDIKLSGGTETILLVEDEKEVRDFVSEILIECGFDVIEAGGPMEAMRKQEEFNGPIDLLLTDMIMPEMNGKEVYQELKKYHPNIKVLYMSGYSPERLSMDEGKNFLSKPFSIKLLVTSVRRILDNGKTNSP